MINIDQLGRKIVLTDLPKRIVSLVPSQTELLFSIGLDSEVLAITKFCVHPQHWATSKIRIGGTKNVDIEKVRILRPDLIIGNKEENTKEDIRELEKIAPVWISDVNNMEEAYQMIEQVGSITGKSAEALVLISAIQDAFRAPAQRKRRVIYVIWKDPVYIAGKHTFIDAMLGQAGYINCCELERYPSLEEAGKLNPELVFLSTEPYPFSKLHITEFQERFPDAKIHVVDGEIFSWYGSRLLRAPDYFNRLADEFSQK
jgi:ABC-type Fe3+-hydroxamate transport system substrate-binding protein